MKKITLITLLLFISNLFSVESTAEGILFSYNGKAESVLLVGSMNDWNENGIKLSTTIWENGNIIQKTGLDGDGSERYFSEQQIKNINEDRVAKKNEGIVSSMADRLIPDGPLISD